MKVAVVIGHDVKSPGAYSTHLHTFEYMYNSEVATYLAGCADIYKRPLGGGYKTQMKTLAAEINAKNYDLVIELHFNCFNKEAHGCEAVIFKGNKTTRAKGEKFCKHITETYRTHNRGVKEVATDADRGYWFLRLMDAPAMILEPFFGDVEESLRFENPGKYAEIIKNVLCK
jgi:N-acetylmuramoyl-L-alanine amidase